jgi:hypothetical protein
LSRVRTFFAFDTYTGTQAIKRFDLGILAGASVLGLYLLFYFAIISACLFFYFGKVIRESGFTLGIKFPAVAAAYALPFWLAFSHPTYHLPLMPLLAIPACAMLEAALRKPSGSLRSFVRESGNRRFFAALAVLLLIQLEWIAVMAESFFEAII